MKNSVIAEEKKRLRAVALSRRDGLDVRSRTEFSQALVAHVGELAMTRGEVVSGFWPIRSEIDVRPLMSALMQTGMILCLPAILNQTTIEFRELVAGLPLQEMGFGTMGPGPQARVLDPEIMLVPLSAFDALGNRIGYGAGYYDRAIERLHRKGINPRLIGVAFDCQQVETIPAEQHDVRLHEILTESGLRRFSTAL